MEKRILVLLCLVSIGISHSHAQKNKIDSLKKELSGAQQAERFDVLSSLINNLIQVSKFNDALSYANEMKALAEHMISEASDTDQLISLKNQLATAYLNLGEANRCLGNFAEALENSTRAKKIFEQTGNKKLLADVYCSIGTINLQQGDYDQSLENISMAKKLYEGYGNKKGLSRALIILGNRLFFLADYPEALKNYFASLRLADSLGDKAGVADAYSYISQVYVEQESYTEAMTTLKNAQSISVEIGNKSMMALNYIYIGFVYRCFDNMQEGLKNVLIAKRICEEIGDKYNLAYACYILGRIYTWLGNYDEATKANLQALKVSETINGKRSIRNAFRGLGATAVARKQYPEGIEYFKKSLATSELIDDKNGMRIDYEILASAYELNNDFYSALKNWQLKSTLQEEIWNDGKSKAIAETQAKYESEKKDNEIALLNKNQQLKDAEIKKQKTLKYSLIAGLALIALLSILVFNNFQTRSKLRLQNIRNKIAGDLHDDIGSTLNSISIFSQVAEQDPAEQKHALQMIGEASRKITESMSDIVWTINSDNDSFSKIIFRMRSFAFNLLRAKNIEFTFRAEESLNEKKLSMEARRNFYLIFKEALNNIVKYADATFVTIDLKETKASLDLCISDNGKGFDKSQISPGNGLNNMKRRAKEMNADLRIQSVIDEGTSIELKLKT